MKLITSLLALFSALICTLSHANLLNINPASVEAESWIILDVQTGQTLASSQAHLQRAPASLTKMMTAYIVLKEIKAGRLDRNEILTAGPIVKTIQWDESQMYLKEGEQVSIDQLLAALIVMSANDAAVTLAERVSGSVPSFVARMNQEAKALGMSDTHFSNPAGITMPDHYASAYDVARLGQALSIETPDYLHYSKQLSFTYKQHLHHATNLVLKRDVSVDGLKTGFTKAAGYNLALTALRPDIAPQPRPMPVAQVPDSAPVSSTTSSTTTSSSPASSTLASATLTATPASSAAVTAVKRTDSNTPASTAVSSTQMAATANASEVSSSASSPVSSAATAVSTDSLAPQRRIIVVVMGAKSAVKRAEIAENLLNLAYTYTRNQVAITGKQFIAEVPVQKSTQKYFRVEAKNPQYVTTALLPALQHIQFDQYNPYAHRLMRIDGQGVHTPIEPLQLTPPELKIELKTASLTAPVDGVMQLAKVNVYQQDQLLQSFDIEDDIHIVEARWYERLWMWLLEKLPFLG